MYNTNTFSSKFLISILSKNLWKIGLIFILASSISFYFFSNKYQYQYHLGYNLKHKLHRDSISKYLRSKETRNYIIQKNNLYTYFKIDSTHPYHGILLDKQLFDHISIDYHDRESMDILVKFPEKEMAENVIKDFIEPLKLKKKEYKSIQVSKLFSYYENENGISKIVSFSLFVSLAVLFVFLILIAIKEKISINAL